MKKTINTYQSLGRLMIDTVYSELLKKGSSIKQQDLKDIVYKKCIEQNSSVDNSFAMHKYNHEKYPSDYSFTYRWENIMNFYLGKQVMSELLQQNTTRDADYAYNLTNDSYEKLLSGKHSCFDEARVILRQKYEQKLRAIQRNKRYRHTW